MIMSSLGYPCFKKAYPDSEIIYLATANLAYVASFFEGINQVIPIRIKVKVDIWMYIVWERCSVNITLI